MAVVNRVCKKCKHESAFIVSNLKEEDIMMSCPKCGNEIKMALTATNANNNNNNDNTNNNGGNNNGGNNSNTNNNGNKESVSIRRPNEDLTEILARVGRGQMNAEDAAETLIRRK